MDSQIALIITALGTAIATLITAIASLIVQMRTSRSVIENTAVTTLTHDTVNHKMDLLLELTKSSAHAEGVVEGQAKMMQMAPALQAPLTLPPAPAPALVLAEGTVEGTLTVTPPKGKEMKG